jgi:uracil phosphoribosyltransferase
MNYGEGIYVGYRYYETRYEDAVMGTANVGDFDYTATVQYPFGYGLSYTTFEWTDFKADRKDDTVTATVTVKNTGDRAGKAVAQLYVAAPEADLIRPDRELKGFAKVELQPGEAKDVSFTLDKRSFAYWNAEIHDWFVVSGDYAVQVGASSRDLPLCDVEIETPISKAVVKELSGRKLAVIPILRAGLGMVDGVLNMIPAAKVGHIGLYRDPDTFEPVEYYCKLPEDCGEREVFVVDPMLATGGTLIESIRYLRKAGVKDIRVLTLVSCPEGISAVLASDPDVRIFTCSVDRCLNDDAYILPGLADAGDRIFGTESGK